MTFEIVIPTYNRIAKLIRCLDSIPQSQNIKIFVYCDNNDSNSAEKIKELYPYVNIIINSTQLRAFGSWNLHLSKYFNSDIFIYLCDDTRLYTDTLQQVDKLFNSLYINTDGIVTFNQVNIKSSDSAMGCVGRAFVNRFPENQIFCPNYKTFYSDTELGEYAKSLNKFTFGKNCKIDHFHPAFFKNEMDSTHNIIRDKEKDIDIKINKLRIEKKYCWGKNFSLINRYEV